MPGISVDVVSYLRTNLRDRYKDSYSILKELLQNADDAGAEELHITTYDSMGPYLKHPLLKGPFVCVVNNAEFTQNDACAIHQAGIGTKGLDEDKIGKFGLGLKSVFHLCEALFYVSSENGERSTKICNCEEKHFRDGILNPWKTSNRYKHWEPVEKHDFANLKQLVEAQFNKSKEGIPKHWFAIFLPLRLPEHCIDLVHANVETLSAAVQLDEAKKWALEPKFPTLPGASEQDLLDARQHIERICGVMPLLTRLRLIRFCHANAENWKSPELKATIDFRCKTERLNWRKMSIGTYREHGTVVVKQKDLTPLESVYAVAQTLADQPKLNEIVRSKSWPWMDALDEVQGWQRKPAVAKQHGAVAILDTHGSGNVSISRAVFLPLAESNNREFQAETPCGGNRSFRVLLHGYCFVDAGRLGIDEVKDGEEASARQTWNQALIDEVVLPLVIPALEEYRDTVSHLTDRDERLQNLTEGLRAAFSLAYASRICRDNSWVYLLRGNQAQWEIHSNATPLISLPYGPHELGTLLKLFPALSKLSKNHEFVLHEMPSLSHGATYKWPLHIAEQLLISVPVDPVTRDPELLKGLLRFCEHLKRKLGNAIESAICDLIQRILADEKVPLSRLRSNEPNRVCFAAILNLVADTRKLWIPFREDLVGESELLMRRLQSVAGKRIVVPSVLDPDKSSLDLTNEEAFAILAELATSEPKRSNADGYRKLMSETVDWILKAWPQAIQQILQEPICELPLFYVKDFASQTNTRLSTFELYAAADEKRLFGGNAQLCDKLQSCVVDQSILYIDSPNKVLISALGFELPPCTPRYCIEFLGIRPQLVEKLAPRVDLLEQLKSARTETEWVKIRFLLHGRTEKSADAIGLVAIDSSPWGTLATHLLGACSQRWRAIDESLLDNLTAAEKRSLRIESCSPANVAQIAFRIDTNLLDLTSLGKNREAFDTIILDWPSGQQESLRKLPIFVRSDGKLTAITDHTFINTGNVAPPCDLFPDLQLIEDPTRAVASRSLAPTLNSQDILKKLLTEPTCHKHWGYILDQLDAAADPAIKNLLSQASWLTAKNGEVISPKHVVCEDSLASHVTKLKAAGAKIFHQSELPAELRAHSQWKRVMVELCPSKTALSKMMGECVGSLSGYRIGARTWHDGLLESLLELFTSSDGIMPAIGLIETLRNLPGISLQQLEQSLLPEVGKRIDLNRSVQVLKHIQTRHQVATSSQRKNYLRIFNIFLDEALTQEGFAERLDEISLLNQTGQWRKSSELAIEGHNIAPTCLVDGTQLEVLRKHRIDAGKTYDSQISNGILSGEGFDESQISSGLRALKEYLMQWRTDEIPGDAVASLIAILGARDGLKEMYDQFKDGRDWQATRNLLLGPQSSQLRFDSYRFWISEGEPRKVDAVNIRGNRFQADVATEITSLFDGFGDGRFIQYIRLPNNEKCFHIRLRKIEVASLNQSQQLEILRNTIIAIRNGIYQLSGGEIDEEWAKITNINQLDIDIAQQLILDSSPILLETQLAGNLPSVLKDIFRDLHSVRQREKTSEQANCSQGELESIRKEKRTIFEQLRQSLCENNDVKRHLIHMIRSRLESQSYDQSSIPFELFQNADDAVVELASLACSNEELERMRPSSLRDQFLIQLDRFGESSVLRFLHWGRGINQYRGSSRENQDFSRDMERMLVLQGSGKHSEGTEKRTGGFGLGFKSTLFVCDEPIVFSGARSRFRVLSGVYPASLSDRKGKDDQLRLKLCLENLGDHNHKGTIIELQLDPAVHADALLERFRAFAGYLVVFSRAISKCDVGSSDSKPTSFVWHPESLLENIDVGDVNGSKGLHRALVFSSAGSTDSVLIPIDTTGVNSQLTAGVPEIWVTTPTGHEGRSGILVNGAFDVNPGRTQLRDTAQNTQRANSIAVALGDGLCNLFEFAANDWSSFCQYIGLIELNHKQFWSSLWTAATKTLGVSATEPAKKVFQSVFFGSQQSGILKLISNHPALPTGLSGDYDVLAQLTTCRWRLDGILARETIWERASRVKRIQDKFRPGTVLSSRTGSELQGICEELFNTLNPLTLKEVLCELIGNSNSVSPEQADELAIFINNAAWKEIEDNETFRSERDAVREVLSQLMFATKDGGWSRSQIILCEQEHQQIRRDERARASFAPMANLLASDYSESAVDFFTVCRGELNAPVSTLAAWLVEANTPELRSAGLTYLCKGDLNGSLQGKIRTDSALRVGSWLSDEETVALASASLEPYYQGFISLLLGFTTYTPPTERPAIDQKKSPPDILDAIYCWWLEKKVEIIRTHDIAVYEQGLPPKLSFSLIEIESELDAKKEWLKLFFRGAMYRIGRLTQQQARQFLEEFENLGWLELLADNSNPSRWFEILDEYLEQDSKRSIYYHYMNQFLAYYQLARWLPRYVRAYEAVSRQGVNLKNLNQITEITDLRTSHIFEGATGFDAPPCYVTMGKGAHFVLREVIRARIRESHSLKESYAVNPQLNQHAFVPSLGVLRLLEEVTGDSSWTATPTSRETYMLQSKRIHALLMEHLGREKATFDGNYDIPLLALTWSNFSKDRERILGFDSDYKSNPEELDFLTESDKYHE